MVRTSEDFVLKSVISYLEKLGYTVSSKYKDKHKNKTGVDIKAYHKNGTQYIVECKGDSRSEKSDNRTIDFQTAIGQITFRMTTKSDTNYYAIAIPAALKGQADKLPAKILKALRLRILLVDEAGNVIVYKR